MAIHNGEFRCDTCHRGFDCAVKLADHITRHDIVGKPYACFVCSIGYRSSQSLNKHLATVHRNEDIPKIAPQHLCKICGEVYEVKDKLNRHLKENHIVIVVGEIHYSGNSTNIEGATGNFSQNEILVPKIHENETKMECFDQLGNKKDLTQMESRMEIEKNVNHNVEVNAISYKDIKYHKVESSLKENWKNLESETDINLQKKKLNEISQTENSTNIGNDSCLMEGLAIESVPSATDSGEKLVKEPNREANSNCDRMEEVNKLCHPDYKTTCDNQSFVSINSPSNPPWLPSKQNYIQPAHQSVVTSVFEQKQDFNIKNSYSNNLHSNASNYKSEDFRNLENNQRHNLTSSMLHINNHKNFYNAMNFKITNDKRDTVYIPSVNDLSILNPPQYVNHELLSKDPLFPPIYNTTSCAPVAPQFFSHTSPIHYEKDAKQKLEIQDYHSQKYISSAFKHVKNQEVNCIPSTNNTNYISNSVLSKNNSEDMSVNHLSSLSRCVNFSNEKINMNIDKTGVHSIKNFQDKNSYR